VYFAFICTDLADSLPKRQAARPAHLERLETLHREGRLLLAGPHPQADDSPGFTGSLIVADFDNLQSAETWAKADPYVAAGVYAEVVIKPFKRVLP
jgi:uncharacterized protein YciI